MSKQKCDTKIHKYTNLALCSRLNMSLFSNLNRVACSASRQSCITLMTKSPKSQVCLSRLVVKTIISQCIILFSRYIGFSFEPFSCCFLHLLFTNLSRHHVYLCSFEAIFLTSYLKKVLLSRDPFLSKF